MENVNDLMVTETLLSLRMLVNVSQIVRNDTRAF